MPNTVEFNTKSNNKHWNFNAHKISSISGDDLTIQTSGNDKIVFIENDTSYNIADFLSSTGYRNGEIIEMLAGHADGRTLVGNGGSYTLQNITTYQDLTATFTSIGLDVNYIPPTGTKTVLYEVQFQFYGIDPDPILHFQALWDGNILEPSKSTQVVSYPPTHPTETVYNLGIAIEVNSSSVDVAKARVGTWTTAKTLSWQAREYSASFEGRIHSTKLWAGANSAQFVCPRVEITATA